MLTKVINMLMIQPHFPFAERPPSDVIAKTHMCMRNSIPCGLINEYTYQNGVHFEIKSMRSFRPSFFIVPVDIISIHADQKFTINAIGMGARIIVIINKQKIIFLENNNNSIYIL